MRAVVLARLPQMNALKGKELGRELWSETEAGKAWTGSCCQIGNCRVLRKTGRASPRTVDPTGQTDK